MKRELTVAVAGAAIVAASVSGCSSNKVTTSASGGTSGSAAASTRVIIDGKNQYVNGEVACRARDGNVNIAIGGPASGVIVVLTDGNPPKVMSANLGEFNGVDLAYTADTGQGNASATKNGKTYKITGTATGSSNPAQPLTRPFEIDVACPS